MPSPRMQRKISVPADPFARLVQGAWLLQIGAALVVQVLHLLVEQDPGLRQAYEYRLFFLTFRSLRHAQARHRVILKVDRVTHLLYSTAAHAACTIAIV